jgi:arsenate reductase
MIPIRVLFLCTGNSCRSQMAEGLLRRVVPPPVAEVLSAGTNPKPLHPNAIRVMAEIGVDISGQRSKALEPLLGQKFDFAITLCDEAQQSCPRFPDATRHLHWSIPDPAAAEGSEAERLLAFRAARNELSGHIEELLQGLFERLLEKSYVGS